MTAHPLPTPSPGAMPAMPAVKETLWHGVVTQNLALVLSAAPQRPASAPAALAPARVRRLKPWLGAVLAVGLSLLPRPTGVHPFPTVAPPQSSVLSSGDLLAAAEVTIGPASWLAGDAIAAFQAAPESATSALSDTAARSPARLPIAALLGLSFRTLVIDPGHGGKDSGAVGPSGLREKDLVLDIAQRLRARLLQRDGYRVLLTRTQDVKMTLKQRVAFANAAGADLFISLHFNTLPQEHINLVETYYFGTEVDAVAAALVAQENRGSEFAAGDFRRVLARLGDTFKREESRALAHSLHQALLAAVGAHDPTRLDAGVKTAPFMVLLGLEAPSVLLEISCLSHPAEERRLADSAYREQLAAALERGLLAYLAPNAAPPVRERYWPSHALR